MEQITVKKIGSFHIGGRKIQLSGLPAYAATVAQGAPPRIVDPNGDFWTGQMYVQYTLLTEPKSPYPVCLWHGGGLSGACWETKPDGGDGWQMYFLRAGYDVYISDSVERGRAAWSRYPDVYTTEPIFRPYAHAWESFRIGPRYDADDERREAYADAQFPVEAFDRLMMQSVPRWASNDAITQAAYDEYLKRVGPSIIIAHSQGGAFAERAALRAPSMVKAIVLLEPSGMPSPDTVDVSRLQNIPHLFIWGDHLGDYPIWKTYYHHIMKYRKALEENKVPVTWIELPERGIRGNSHMLFNDRNSDEIAALVHQWITVHTD